MMRNGGFRDEEWHAPTNSLDRFFMVWGTMR